MSEEYLELAEDEMVEYLSDLQKHARELMETGRATPYNKKAHENAAEAMMRKLKDLASSGDVV